MAFFKFRCLSRMMKKHIVNELRSHLNENNLEDKMTKKDLKESKVTRYINKVPFF